MHCSLLRCSKFRKLCRWLTSRAVVHQHFRCERNISTDRVPHRRAILPPLHPIQIWRTTCSHDDNVWILCKYVFLLRERIQPDLDTESFELLNPPVDDADEVSPPSRPCCHQDLATKL